MILFMIAGELSAALINVVFANAIDVSTSHRAGFAFIGLRYVVSCIVVWLIYRGKFVRAAKAVGPYVATSLVLASVATFLFRPFAYEAFVIPTNAMAPTLLGDHLEARCPDCGSPAYGAPPDPRQPASPDGIQMVCSNELKTVYVKNAPPIKDGGDKILVCKHLTPKRWDLIVFHNPAEPSVNYAKRLVGFPNEKVEIRDGAVWINDQKMEPPESIRKIHYSPTITTHGQVFSGPGSIPVTLGPDEYFVLGDFVDASSDSRFWEQGAPGHPPYAVPASNIVGVVINIYWPPDRWASFR
jgi:signal peptidase I